MINVTKTYLPPISEYIKYLEKIWESGVITNQGPLVRELEHRLSEYLKTNNFYYLNNGTIALQIAIKALNLTGEVITSPFSYVATTSSIVWEGCTPVFADIDPQTLCISPTEIEKKITQKTTGIIATHVFGNCCDFEAIEFLAKKYNLKVIYDGAHAFGVTYRGNSIVDFGDFTTFSFHATKLFHTIEGGGIATNNSEYGRIAEYQRRFGHKGQEDFHGIGINGKNSEFHAAMGLCLFPRINEIINIRKELTEKYNQLLEVLPISRPIINPFSEYNYAYYPVVFENEEILLKVRGELNSRNIFPRRYFFPSLNTLQYLVYERMPISESVSKRILCLPFYEGITTSELEEISNVIIKVMLHKN